MTQQFTKHIFETEPMFVKHLGAKKKNIDILQMNLDVFGKPIAVYLTLAAVTSSA